MSGALLVLEAVGITAAAVGVVLAQNPPEDLRDWWSRQEWLQRMIMPSDGSEVPDGLAILPWQDGAATDVPTGLPEDVAPSRPADTG